MTGGKAPECLDCLAAAYAAAGRFPEAVETAQKAIQAASSSGRSELAKAIEARIELYRNNHPYREPTHPARHPIE